MSVSGEMASAIENRTADFVSQFERVAQDQMIGVTP
jgi:hypothetical protein